MRTAPLMPKGTAMWLIENTALTFDQIADFCQLHVIEVEALANREVAIGLMPTDPIARLILTWEEIDRCQKDPALKLKIQATAAEELIKKKKTRKGGHYTPIAKRQDIPNAILWLIRTYPELTDNQIRRLLGTTSNTIKAIREKRHRSMAHLKPAHPVHLGICSPTEFDAILEELHTAQSSPSLSAA